MNRIAYMTKECFSLLYSAKTTVSSVTRDLSYYIHSLKTFNIADPSSMQEMCHIET